MNKIDDVGGIYDIDGHCCAFYPGAYSVDRGYRLVYGLPYEMEEQLTDLEFEALNKKTVEYADDFEFVFSHTCPMSVEPLIRYLFMDGLDQSKIDKTTE